MQILPQAINKITCAMIHANTTTKYQQVCMYMSLVTAECKLLGSYSNNIECVVKQLDIYNVHVNITLHM